MKTREFRIGNILTDGKFMFTVESIEQEAVWGDIFECTKIERPEDCYDTGDYHFNIENIEGIPLTEEWLLKFGLEWSIFHQATHKTGFEYDLNSLYEGGYSLSTFKREHIVVEKIKYVHQLQNLYFALTGEELTHETT